MPLTGAEQYMLELINRARLDPAAEAARYGVDLNAGLAPGTLTAEARQVLAPDAALAQAAALHSQWMIATDTFSHTGSGGSSAGQRATDAGYTWNRVGENLAMLGTTGSIDAADAIAAHNAALFRSALHRENILNGAFGEVGLGQEIGAFTQGGSTYQASLLTQLFGQSGGHAYVTGVAYSDRDGDGSYSIGEGREGVVFTSGGRSDRTEAAGGYALAVAAGADVDVTGRVGDRGFAFSLDTRPGNVKIDIVNGVLIRSSGDIDLGRGFAQVTLLGVGDIDAAGSAAGDRITGNGGDNVLRGEGGSDALRGGAGRDALAGDAGADWLRGGDGNDVLRGGAGRDRLWGEDGADVLAGGAGDDWLSGGDRADRFVFAAGGGRDTVTDLSRFSGDRLVLDDNLWDGRMTAQQIVNTFAEVRNGDIVLSFDAATELRLDGITNVQGLAGLIVLI